MYHEYLMQIQAIWSKMSGWDPHRGGGDQSTLPMGPPAIPSYPNPCQALSNQSPPLIKLVLFLNGGRCKPMDWWTHISTNQHSYFGLHIPTLHQAKRTTHKEGGGPTWKWRGRPTTTILHTMSYTMCFLNPQKNAIKRSVQVKLT
jgi:hypothetical protein